MTIAYGLPIITGVAADTKPTTNLNAGYLFFETDTRRTYYWDGATWTLSSGAYSIVQYGTVINNVSTNSVLYYGINASDGQTNEALKKIVTDYDLIMKRMRVTVAANTKSASTTLTFRDDSADVTGSSISITAAATGEFDTGAITQTIASGSKINFKMDASASASGSITIGAVLATFFVSTQ